MNTLCNSIYNVTVSEVNSLSEYVYNIYWEQGYEGSYEDFLLDKYEDYEFIEKITSDTIYTEYLKEKAVLLIEKAAAEENLHRFSIRDIEVRKNGKERWIFVAYVNYVARKSSSHKIYGILDVNGWECQYFKK